MIKMYKGHEPDPHSEHCINSTYLIIIVALFVFSTFSSLLFRVERPDLSLNRSPIKKSLPSHIWIMQILTLPNTACA